MPSLLSPRLWGAHLLALVLVGAAVTLGWWQFGSWQDRRAFEAADLTVLEPVPIEDVLGPDDPFPGDQVGQPAVVAGTWLPDSTVFVSDRPHEGEDGYWVVTPLAIGEASGSALPVVRGWVAAPEGAPAPPSGEAELVVWMQPTEGRLIADPDPTDDVIPQVRVADLIQHVDQDLYGAFGVIATDVADGDWPVGPAAVNDGSEGLAAATVDQLPSAGVFTALKNLLYAIEWWIFAAFAAFIWWRYVTDVTARWRSEESGRQEPEEHPVPSAP